MSSSDSPTAPDARGQHPNMAARQRLAHHLLDAGLLDQNQYDTALKRQAETGGDLIDVLLNLGYVEAGDVVGFLLERTAITPEALSFLEIPRSLLSRLPEDLVRNFQAIPIDELGGTLTVGAASPLDPEVLDALEKAAGKPVRPLVCPPDDVKAAIDRYYPGAAATPGTREEAAVGVRAQMRLHHVAHLIRQLKTLPALPETVHQVQEAVSNPDVTMSSVVDAITLDPPIAAKVLSVANSAAYGFSQKITDLTLAVSLMGLRETYYLVLSAAVVDVLNRSRNFDYRKFFLDAICCAAASRIVAATAGKRHLPGIFTAGLLHDVGRAALFEAAPELCAKLDKELMGRDLIAAEEQVVGISHAEAGYELARHWNLPEELAEPIRFHHAPELARNCPEQVAMVALAAEMVGASGDDLEAAAKMFDRHEVALGILGIDTEAAEAMLETYLKRHAKAVREAFE